MSFDTLNSAMDLLPDYGNLFFQGKVIKNDDPLNIGRIQASVPGLYDPGVGELPWIGPIKFSPFGQGPNWGVYGSPSVGSDVIILLQQGNPHHPVYQTLQSHSNNDFPTGGASWGYKDPYGNSFKCLLDNTIQFHAASGVTLSISPSGDLTVSTSGGTTIQSIGDISIHSSGRLDVSSSNGMSFTAPRIDWNKS